MVDLNPKLPLSAIRDFCQRFPVQELSVFGSTIRGEHRQDSDVDLLVSFKPEARIGFLTLVRLAREFSELLHRGVDLVPKDGLNPRIRNEVIAQAEVLFAA